MKVHECNTCRHWDNPDGEKPKHFVDGIHGQCLRALFDDDNGADYSKEPMITMDSSCYMAVLFTLPDHSCKAWEVQ